MTKSPNKEKLGDVKSFHKLTIDNFPSRLELYSLLNNFLTDNKIERDYKANNKEKGVEFIFDNKVLYIIK